MSTRPQRSTANRHPAAPVIEAKQTRRSAAEVSRDKAKIEAKQRALLKRNEDNLRKLQELQRDLDAQEKENATQAARPPPEQPVSEKLATSAPLTPLPVKAPRPRPVSKADGRAAIEDDDFVKDSPVGQRVQPGRMKRLRREDLEALDVGPTSGATTVVVPAAGANVVKTQVSTKDKKRKSEGLGKDEPAKKGKPTRPSGPTSAAAAKFALPLTATRTSSASHPASIALSSAISTESPNLPQGVFVKDVGGGFELAEADAATTKHDDSDAVEATQAGSKGINLQLEVVDVAASTVAAGSTPTPVAGAYAVSSTATPKGGWSMRQLEPMLGSFSGTFTHIFIPKLINFISNTASGPWKLTNVNLAGAMKDLAGQSFPKELLVSGVAPRQPFYEVAKQKLSEYRNGVGNEAVDVVSHYMQSRRFPSVEARAEYVEWATCAGNGFLFRYERITQGDDGKTLKKHGLYQSTLIAQTFVYHLNRIGKSGDQIRDWPCNALALTAVAVERALKMWRTGSYVAPPSRTEEGKFSDKAWGGSAQQYLEGITNLTEEKWDKILAKADRARRGYSLDTDDELDESDDLDEREDIPLIGRAGIDDDDDDDADIEIEDEDESQEMEGVELAGDANN